MDFDAGIGAGLGAIIGGGIATVLDWLDRNRIGQQFSQLNDKVGEVQNKLATQEAEIKAIEKSQDGTSLRLNNMDQKIDKLLIEVGKITGALAKNS